MIEKSFDHLVRELVVDEVVSDRLLLKTSRPEKTYAILFTPTSGSTWLTSVLEASNVLGRPDEYLNPNFTRATALSFNTTDKYKFIQLIMRNNQSEGGVFGIELRAVDAQLFGEDLFFPNHTR